MDWSLLPLGGLSADIANVLMGCLSDASADLAVFKPDLLDLSESMVKYGTKAAAGDKEAAEILALVKQRAGLIYARILNVESKQLADRLQQAVTIGLQILVPVLKAALAA